MSEPTAILEGLARIDGLLREFQSVETVDGERALSAEQAPICIDANGSWS